MGAPHNKQRYGELWPQHRIDACLLELEAVKPWVIISGGWAWHFMSPKDHREYKHAHDHKDMDLFVEPANVALVVSTLKQRQFERVWTRYDQLPSEEDFRRYEKHVLGMEGGSSVRLTIDFFVAKDLPVRELDGWNVLDPKYLLSLYSNIHSSDKCFAVQTATKLLSQGIDPVGREEMVTIPNGLKV